MKIADLRAKTADQLKDDLLALAKEQMGFRFQKASGQLEKASRIRAVRRDVARIKTAMAEISQGKAPAAKPAKKAAATKKKKETKE